MLEVLVALLAASLVILLLSQTLSIFALRFTKLEAKANNFDRAVQAFLWIRQDFDEARRVEFPLHAEFQSHLSPEEDLLYPLQQNVQILAAPLPCFKLSIAYAGGDSIWTVHAWRPWRNVVGRGGENFLLGTSTDRLKAHALKHLSEGDIIALKEAHQVQLFKVKQANALKITLNEALIHSLDNAQLGLLSSRLWYVGQTGQGKKALYRWQDGSAEKMVEGVENLALKIQKNPVRMELVIQVEGVKYEFASS